MRDLIFVRPVRQSDASAFADWSLHTANNLFDPDVASYPTTTVFAAFNRKHPVLFAPVQRPLMIDSLSINPDADVSEVATALKEINRAVVTQAYIENRGEIYFMCKDESTIEFAKRQAYEEMPWKLFRIKLKNLEVSADELRN